MKLEYDTWYWVSDPREGDIWFPVFVNSNFEYVLDGEFRSILELKELTVYKAIMPLTN